MPASVVRLGPFTDSPTLGLLLDLERAGCAVRLGASAVEITPVRLITPELRARIAQRSADLKLLLRVLDAGVQARAARFADQYADGSTAFLRLVDPSLEPFQCFSCGETIGARRGRCWRCALAWRLVVGLPLEASVSTREAA